MTTLKVGLFLTKGNTKDEIAKELQDHGYDPSDDAIARMIALKALPEAARTKLMKKAAKDLTHMKERFETERKQPENRDKIRADLKQKMRNLREASQRARQAGSPAARQYFQAAKEEISRSTVLPTEKALTDRIKEDAEPELRRKTEAAWARTCRRCKKSAMETVIKTCKACRNAFYCSPACQKADWRTHKPACFSEID
jgi:hypothetical protein